MRKYIIHNYYTDCVIHECYVVLFFNKMYSLNTKKNNSIGYFPV